MSENDLHTPQPDEELLHEPDVDVSHPADAADHIEALDIQDQVKFVKQLPVKDAANSIAEMELRDQASLMESLNLGLAVRIVESMSPDDAADLLDALDEEHRREVLKRMAAEDRAGLKALLTFDPDTAGGVMNTQVVILSEDLSADQAVTTIRDQVEDKEVPYYAYLVDKEQRLTGVVSLRDLLVAKRGLKLKDLVKTQSLITVTYDEDKEEVARLIGHYNLLALPVVDFGNRILGVVTVDDGIDIIHEEASEDMQAMVGAGADETTDSPVFYSIKKRLPWLVVNMLNSAIAAWVVHLFEGTIAQMAVLAVLMPIVANQAGNTGQQALAVMIRQLALEKFDRKRSWLAVFRELRIGLLTGVLIAGAVTGAVFLLGHNVNLAICVGLALGIDMLVGAVAGASIPLVLREIGRDPAQASSIFLTAITDTGGFFALLGLAQIMIIN